MDKLLREALESDALPPADLTDRIMAQVVVTPQNAAKRKKNPYWKWMISAAACLVVAAAAIPLALNSNAPKADTASDTAVNSAAPEDGSEGDMATAPAPTSDAHAAQENRTGEAAKQDSAHDQPYDPMDTALDSAAQLLHQQGYVLEVTVRGDTAVQVTASDGSGHPCEDNSIIESAMTAAGFTASDDWYVLTQEETQ